ncbi:AI-2E family transporter [Spirochaeta africana]|uniref:Putative permease n=1 Tax=Spirochaeta africana (strain ATCC 700263 / DSM 8902 / Z-7692) TaxID=889378 RepID=H9UJU8_SPIAZ|nr:AI-2E family transporter [Spirochaeta africana]AFG37791.1 putative permease [Spirochaeta africana DSM 8902]
MENTRLNTGLLLVIALVLVGTVLRMIGSFVLPLVIAGLLAFAVYPIIRLLTRLYVPRILSITAVIVLILGAGFLVGLILYTSGQQLLRQFPSYQRRFIEIIEALAENFNVPAEMIAEFNIMRTVSSYLFALSGGFISFISGFVMVMLFLLFILVEAPYIQTKVVAAIEGPRTDKIMRLTMHINEQVGHYLGLKLLTSALTGGIVTAGFSLVGVDFAIIWGILTFMFNFIPNIGSIIISAVSFLFILVQFYPEPNPIILASAIMWLSQLIIGNIVDPKLQGDRLNLSPVVIIFSLLFWGWLWGVVGMFLAVPLTMVIKIVCGNIPDMRPISVMMESGKAVARNYEAAAEASPVGDTQDTN